MVKLRLFLSLILLAFTSIGAEDVGSVFFNYGDALDKSLLFYEAQRSGLLPTNQRVTWRGDSGLQDGFSEGANLVGGYYDAGDHVKFGMPMAFAVTMLAWGAIDFRQQMMEVNQMDHTLAAIKWGTDYFIRAHPQPNVLWAQVGDGDSDHYCWQRAEDMTTPRNAYKLDEAHPGSDLAGETAAALAAASLAFQPYNSTYAALLLVHAKQLFSFADTFRGQYDDTIECAQKFYPSSGYSDELLWAATWIYKANKEVYYLKYVIDNAVSMGGTGWAVKEFSWDSKYAGLQILLAKILMDGECDVAYVDTLKQYQAKANYFACACLQKNDGYNVNFTPGGLMYVREWNNMQYVSSAAFLMAVYSDYLTKATLPCPNQPPVLPLELLNFAKSQGDYMLGKNPKSMSYIVGYGENYPVYVHHRGASIKSTNVLKTTVGCVEGFDSWYRRPEGNPNIIFGALVGGPTNTDEFCDDRSNYEQTEPTLSGCAPLVGLFAKLQSAFPQKVVYYSTSENINGNVVPAQPSPPSVNPPIEFIHSITNSWTVGTTSFYRHQVIMKNIIQNPINNLQLRIENLSGPLWGLVQTPQQPNIYELPNYVNVINPGSEIIFVYIQGGPQATISIQSYN